jgi:gas vesicle protein
MDRLDSYLNQICWSIGGPKALREHVRQELRAHLLDAVEQHKTAGLTDEEAVTKAMEEFGRPEDLRPELEATHGHRMLAVLIDRALQWKERTMRAKWMWSSWAYLTLSLVVALELLFIAFNMYFIFPKFQALVYDGFIDAGSVRHAGNSWMLVFLDRLGTVHVNHTWWILLAALVAIGLFEWRVKGENKSLMRLSALGTSALGLFLVVIVMTVSLVVTFCLAAPEVGPMVRPWAVEQVASIGAAIDGIEQARVKKDWDTMQDQAEQASSTTERLARGPAIHSLVGWSASRKLRDGVNATTENLRDVQKAIREKDEIRLSTSLRELRNSYEPVRDVSKRSPASGRERSPG